MSELRSDQTGIARMRYWMCAWLVAIVVTASITSAADLVTRGDPSGALIALEKKWVAALQRADTKSLSALWAQTYVDTDETGHRSDKAEALRVLKSGALKVRKLQLSDMKAYVYGNAAVVTGASAQDGDFQGLPLAAKIVFTDTFVRDGDTWKAVASQRTASQ
jgi:Domain of unknown function (DUF4440)